jgi:hypothetical protein
MKQKTLKKLQELYPNQVFREGDFTIRWNVNSLCLDDLDKLSMVEGMYTDLLVKRSGTGIVIILNFDE